MNLLHPVETCQLQIQPSTRGGSEPSKPKEMRILDGTLGGFAVTGLQLALLLLALHPGVSQPVSDNENDIAALPPDADNVEVRVSALSTVGATDTFDSLHQFHHVKVVDGVMHENHPVVMYKEDFVSEDYGEYSSLHPCTPT